MSIDNLCIYDMKSIMPCMKSLIDTKYDATLTKHDKGCIITHTGETVDQGPRSHKVQKGVYSGGAKVLWR